MGFMGFNGGMCEKRLFMVYGIQGAALVHALSSALTLPSLSLLPVSLYFTLRMIILIILILLIN